jgi:hypothetical protein
MAAAALSFGPPVEYLLEGCDLDLLAEALSPNRVSMKPSIDSGIEGRWVRWATVIFSEAGRRAAAVDVALLDCPLPGETMWQIVLESDRQQVPVTLMSGDPAKMKRATAGTFLSSNHSAPRNSNAF